MDDKQSVQVFKSLADETRLSIVRKLAQINVEVNSQDIVLDCSLALQLTQPTMSHHFNKLVAAGVLIERKDGKEKLYRLNKRLLKSVGIDARKI